MTAAPARQRIIGAFHREYVDDLLQGDYECLADLALTALAEPTNETVDIFLQELANQPANRPDPSADDHDPSASRTTSQRLAITRAWRRAFDLMRAGAGR